MKTLEDIQHLLEQYQAERDNAPHLPQYGTLTCCSKKKKCCKKYKRKGKYCGSCPNK